MIDLIYRYSTKHGEGAGSWRPARYPNNGVSVQLTVHASYNYKTIPYMHKIKNIITSLVATYFSETGNNCIVR